MRTIRHILLSSFSLLSVLSLTIAWAAEPFVEGLPTGDVKGVVEKMTGWNPAQLAERYGIEEVMGKPVTEPARPQSKSEFPDAEIKALKTETGVADQPVGTDPFLDENEPSVSVSPIDPNRIVVLTHHLNAPPSGNRVGSYWSDDGGATWNGPNFLPFAVDGDSHSDPVVRYSPTGEVVYACYMSTREFGETADIVVSKSIDNGETWQPPVIAIKGKDYDNDGFLDFPEKPWCDVHTFAETHTQKSKLYVTTTLFYANGDISILFARSLNQGNSFNPPEILDTATFDSDIVLQGSRPIGGNGKDVLACWYNSEQDGSLNGVFDIRCKKSGNFGHSWGDQFAAVDNMSYELPFWLGPFASFHRWWGGMFPSVMITADGVAHIAFAADPVEGSSSTEDGDIYYVRSPQPYDSWSRPTRLNDDDDEHAQGYVTITAKKVNGGNVVSVCWEDHRESSVNELYDTYCDTTLPAWGDDKRLSDISSYSDFIFIGDYIDSSTSKDEMDRRTYVIWTDRGDKDSQFDPEDDVWADKLEY